MTSRIDYRKWDNLQVSDDEEESDHEQGPRVTTLREPGSFTIGPQGTTYKGSSTSSSSNPVSSAVSSSQSTESANPSISSSSSSSSSSSISAPVSIFGNTSSPSRTLSEDVWSKNGSATKQFWWSQDRKEVILRTKLNVNTKASNVHVKVVAAADWSITQKSSLHVSLSLPSGTNSILFGGTLRYPITTNDVSDGDCAVDWELKTMKEGNDDQSSFKMLEITLKKKSPIADAIIWWKNVFEGDPEIDVMSIEGRTLPGNAQGTLGDNIDKNKKSTFEDTWAEAHKQFTQKVASDNAIPIDVEDEDERTVET